MRDTTPEVDEMMRKMMQMKSSDERLKMGCSMYETSRYLVIRAILSDHPDISEVDLRKELFLRFYGNDFDEAGREEVIRHFERSE
jgi:hypothetical protein